MNLKNRNRIMLYPKLNKLLIILITVAFVITGLRGYQLFRYIFEDNVKNAGTITIPYEATFDQVLDSLRAKDILKNEKAFRWVSGKKDYPGHIKAGRYLFQSGQNTNSMVNMLKAGNQKAVSIIFNNLRFMEELAGKVSRYIASDSSDLIAYLTDSTVIKKLGFNKYSFHAMFIPNTYEMYWTTTPEKFAQRMKTEYDHFWNEERKAKAEEQELTPIEVITIASIVQEETTKEEEKPVVAGLYLNRIRRGIPLQADPTIRYALGNFGIRRILTKYLEIDSPYNTYKYAGLPPGPINFPEISSIDAVLNAERHNYLYMCAKEDFSGYHHFARTLREHNRNAKRYREALDRQKIWE